MMPGGRSDWSSSSNSFLSCDLVAFKSLLAPAHGALAGADDGGFAADGAVGSEREVGDALNDGVLVADAR